MSADPATIALTKYFLKLHLKPLPVQWVSTLRSLYAVMWTEALLKGRRGWLRNAVNRDWDKAHAALRVRAESVEDALKQIALPDTLLAHTAWGETGRRINAQTFLEFSTEIDQLGREGLVDALGTQYEDPELNWASTVLPALIGQYINRAPFRARPPEDAAPILVAAVSAGLWCFHVLTDRVIAVKTPRITFDSDALDLPHNDSGPAIIWSDGTTEWYWRGIRVPNTLIQHPERITPESILSQQNVELRRIMIESYGFDRYLEAQGGSVLHSEETGTLYRIEQLGDEPLVLVEVTDATPMKNGEFKRYVLRVPPTVTTAYEAVAWTFGVTDGNYQPAIQT